MFSYKKDYEKSDCNCHENDKHEDSKTDRCNDKDKKENKDRRDDKKDHKPHPPHHKTCVREVLAAILKAQKKAEHEDECKTSCNESIKELLGEHKKPKKNTIPFILYNEDAEPFKGTGVTTFHDSKHKKFACITSFIFRIKQLDGKCAVIELLTFKHSKCSHDPNQDCRKKNTPCGQIDDKNVDDLIKTGICITVDLSCFCAVTCLPAVRL